MSIISIEGSNCKIKMIIVKSKKENSAKKIIKPEKRPAKRRKTWTNKCDLVAITMHYNGYSWLEIGKRLNRSETAIRTHLTHLRKIYKKDDMYNWAVEI